MPEMRKRVRNNPEYFVQADGLYVHSNPPRVLHITSAYIKQLIRSGDVDKLQNLVFEGQGKRLIGGYSADYKVRTFLKSVPNIMSKINLMHDAVNSGRLEELQTLLEEEPERKKYILAKDEAGIGLLHKAVYYNLTDIAKWIIENYPQTVTVKDADGRTPCHYTPLCKDSHEMQKLLVNAGADIAALDNKQHSTKYYMSRVSELELPSVHKSLSSSTKTTPVKEGVVIKKSNIRIWIHHRDLANLQKVVWEGHGSKLLVEHSTNSKVKKFLEAVPHILGLIKDIHTDVQNDDLEALKSHSSAPVPPVVLTGKDSNGLTPLHKAAGLGRQEIAEYIVETYPNSVLLLDNEGRSPLHYSTLPKDDGKMFDFLIGAGADESVLDNKDKTAAYYKNRATELDHKLLSVIPDSPRTAKDGFAASWDWNLLSNSPSSEIISKSIKKTAKEDTREEENNQEDEEKQANEVPENENKDEEITQNGTTDESVPENVEAKEEPATGEVNDEAENKIDKQPIENNNEEIPEPAEVQSNSPEDNKAEEESTANKEEEPEPQPEKTEEQVDDKQVVEENEKNNSKEKTENEENVDKVDDIKVENSETEEKEAIDDTQAINETPSDTNDEQVTPSTNDNNQVPDDNNKVPDDNNKVPDDNNKVPDDSNKMEDEQIENKPTENTNDDEEKNESNNEVNTIDNLTNGTTEIEAPESISETVKTPIDTTDGGVGVIEGVVNGENEVESVNEQGQGVNDKADDPEIINLIEEGNMEQLAALVLNGDGEKLIGYTSENSELQAFLDNVPTYMSKINRIHVAARNGSLRDLQAALDRRKFAIAKDHISPNGASPLHVATVFGNTSIVRYLAGRFPETVQAADSTDRTPLHYAAVLADNGHYYNLLVHLGADVRAEDKLGYTPDYYRTNQEEFSHRTLLQDFGAEEATEEILSDKDKSTNNVQVDMPFFYTEEGRYLASSLGDPLIKGLTEVANKRPEDPIAYLATYLYNFANNDKSRNKTQETHQVITGPPQDVDNNNAIPTTIDVVTLDPDDENANEEESAFNSTSRDEHGQSMLHFAAARAHSRNALFQLLLETDINVGYRDELYRTARDISIQANIPENTNELDKYLMQIACKGDTDKLVELLLDGYDHITDVVDEDDVPIIEAVSTKGQSDTVSFLQSILTFEEKRERVHFAIRQGSIGEVTSLLADENDTGSGKLLAIGKNSYGRCALHIAVLCQQEEIVDYLVNTFPDCLHIGDNLERTALHYSMGIDKMESISKLLIKAGARRVVKDLKGRQPTYYFMNKSDILRLQEEEETF